MSTRARGRAGASSRAESPRRSGAGIGDAWRSPADDPDQRPPGKFRWSERGRRRYIDVLSSSDAPQGLTSRRHLSPSFAPATLSYADSVANRRKEITVTPQTTDSSATYALKEGGKPVSNPIALDAGDNSRLVVTAATHTSQTYVVTVTGKSHERLPEGAHGLGRTLSPGFAPHT